MARQSGTAAESETIRNAANAAEERTTGSWVETPKTKLFSHRDAPQLPASPAINPITPNLAACLPVRRKMATASPLPLPYESRPPPSAANPVVENTIATDAGQDHRNPGEEDQQKRGESPLYKCGTEPRIGGFQRLNGTLPSMEANVCPTVAIILSGLPLVRIITTIAASTR